MCPASNFSHLADAAAGSAIYVAGMTAVAPVAAELVPPPAVDWLPRRGIRTGADPERVIGAPVGSQDPDVNPRLLRCFVEVAQERHFGRAADRLFVAQPALSRSIQQLERHLGYRLFVRTTRSVELTPAAGRLLPAAREVLDALDAVGESLVAGDRTLNVAHVPFSDTAALILDALAQSDPDITVTEQTMSCAQQLRAVRVGRLDVAVCPAPGDLDSQLRATLVRLDPLLVGLLGRDAASDRPVDPRRRPVAVPDSGAEDPEFGAFVSQYEQVAGCTLRRIRVAPGSGTEAYAIRRSGGAAFVTLASRSIRLDAAHRVVGTIPVQAYLPWAAIARRSDRSPATEAFLQAAERVARARRWRSDDRLPGMPWVPRLTTRRHDQWVRPA